MSTQTPVRRARSTRSRWLGLLITVLVLFAWGLFLREQLDELQHYSWQLAPGLFALGIVFGTLYSAGLALGWTLLLRSMLGTHRYVAIGAAMRVWLLSMMTRYVPGNVWHILSRMAMAGKLGAPATQILTSATIEQLLVILAALTVAGLTLPFWGVLPGIPGWVWFMLLLPVGLLLLHPRIMGRILAWAAVRFKRAELAWDYPYSHIVLILLVYCVPTISAGLALYAILWGLTPVSLQHLPLVVGASALAWVVGYLSFLTPSGLGVREAALVALLSQIYALPVAIVGSLLYRLVATLGELCAVLIAWIYGLRTNDS